MSLTRRSFFASVALTCAGLLHARVAKWVPPRKVDISLRDAFVEFGDLFFTYFNTPLGVTDRMYRFTYVSEHLGEPDA